MKRIAWTFGLLAVGTTFALAQPPEGPRGREGGRGDFRPMNPLVEALDTNGDREISAEELKAAAESLAKLDTNKDGKLTEEELRPRPNQGGDRGRGPEGRGPEGRGPEGRGPEGRGPEGRGPEGRGPEGRGPEGRGPEGRGPEGRGPEGRGPEGRGPEGRGPEGGPSPDRMVDQAMSFDTDKDGKLSRDELFKFAQEFIQRRGGRGGRPEGGEPGQRPQNEERPRRPD